MDIVIESDGPGASVTEADLYRSPDFFRAESDRGVVLALTAIIERMLGTMMGALAGGAKPRVLAGLVSGAGPLATLAARADVLSVFGVLNEQLRRDMHRLDALRARVAAEWATFVIDDVVEGEVVDQLWTRRAFADWCPDFATTGLRRFWNARDRFEYFVGCEVAVINRLLAGDVGRSCRRRRRWRATLGLDTGMSTAVDRTMTDSEAGLFDLVLGEAVRMGVGFKPSAESGFPPGAIVSAKVERARRQALAPGAFTKRDEDESRATLLLMRPGAARPDGA
ncbi:MAG TPA: hypothetical protein VEL07_16610 [Planctomycetota bacterium]|nr:hypothetical protein [Planctomycetota bacterium]